MLYLILAIASSALVSVLMRLSDRRITGNIAMLTVNYFMCFLLAAAYAGFGKLLPDAAGLGGALVMGSVNGLLYLGGFVLLQINVRRNGVVLSSTFMKLGVLVPTILSVTVFGETPGALQVAGFLGALAAIGLIHFEGGSSRVENRWALLLLLLGGGMADAMSKIYEELGHASQKDRYLFYTFLTALILCVGLMLLRKQRVGRPELFFGLLVGIPNYFSSRFLLLSLNAVPAVVAFPTFSVGTILVVSCVGVLFFREKLSRRRAAALGVILLSLVLLNL